MTLVIPAKTPNVLALLFALLSLAKISSAPKTPENLEEQQKCRCEHDTEKL
jgi:hypothetical protein